MEREKTCITFPTPDFSKAMARCVATLPAPINTIERGLPVAFPVISPFTDMDILPLELVCVLWLAYFIGMTECQDA